MLFRSVLFRKKWGFILPMDAWLRGPLKGIVQTVLAPGAVERRGLFQPAAVQAVLADHLSGRRNLGHHLWQLLVLEL